MYFLIFAIGAFFDALFNALLYNVSAAERERIMDKNSHRMANLTVFPSDRVVERRSHHSSESVIVKPRSYDNNESRTEVNRATQHIALDVEKKEQEYLKIRLEHSVNIINSYNKSVVLVRFLFFYQLLRALYRH